MDLPSTSIKITFRAHAIQRMFERSISKDDVVSAIKYGTSIETYPHDNPFPSELLCHKLPDKVIHIVVAKNSKDNEVIVITVYIPDNTLWCNDYTKRKYP